MGLQERRKAASSRFTSASRLYSRTVIINVLRLSWIVVLIWGELGSFFWSLSSCKWPDSILPQGSAKPTHVMLLSDPQVRSPHVFREEDSWLGVLRQFIFESNLKRSWLVSTRLKPQMIVFLGDMLSSGRLVKTEQEFKEYADKFKSIFSTNPLIPTYFIPGNNDIGMGLSQPLSRHVRRHYSDVFGPFNQVISVRNHTFVLIDAPGLVDEDYQRSAQGLTYEEWTPNPGGPVEFVKALPVDNEHPTVLLSHIPLSRPDSASCGPLRERGNIHKGVGHGYQNTLGKETTAFLLNQIRPSAVFSGDNRDYCEYIHLVDASKTEDLLREVTVKSFSTVRHIKRPGFQLLSVTEPGQPASGKVLADTPCLLPDQYGIYSKLYLPLGILTVLGLLLFNIRRVRKVRKGFNYLPPIVLSPQSNSNLSSRANTPFQPDSAAWSPYTPVPVSPRGLLPSSLRTPNPNSGPSQRSASRPTTPHTMLSPMAAYHQKEEDEEDPMSPAQYAMRTDNGHHDSWSPELDSSHRLLDLLPSPGLKPTFSVPARERWSWSYTFAFRGRMRRITFRLPTVSKTSLVDLVGLLELADSEISLRRRGVWKSTCIDTMSIVWIALLSWIVIAWWLA